MTDLREVLAKEFRHPEGRKDWIEIGAAPDEIAAVAIDTLASHLGDDLLRFVERECPKDECDEGQIERLATPDEVDAGYELGIAWDPCPSCKGTGKVVVPEVLRAESAAKEVNRWAVWLTPRPVEGEK